MPPVFHRAARVEQHGRAADNLKGEYFITTGSGKFLRNVQDDPEHNIGIVEINDAATAGALCGALRTARARRANSRATL